MLSDFLQSIKLYRNNLNLLWAGDISKEKSKVRVDYPA